MTTDIQPVPDLPFYCEECDTPFGFGDDAIAFLSFATSVPFTDAPKPCCGETISGELIRHSSGVVEMRLS